MDIFRNIFKSIQTDKKHKFYWRALATTLAGVVVFVTTYSLILPAITMEAEVAEELPGFYMEEDGFESDEIVPDSDTDEEDDGIVSADSGFEETGENESSGEAWDSDAIIIDEENEDGSADEPFVSGVQEEYPSYTIRELTQEIENTKTKDKIKVHLSFDENASIPDGTLLEVLDLSEEEKGSEYDAYEEAAEDAIRSDDDSWTDYSIRLYALNLLYGDERVIPEDKVGVELQFTPHISDGQYKVLCFDDIDLEQYTDEVPLPLVLEEDEVTFKYAEDGSIEQIAFDADSLCLIGIAENKTVDTSIGSENTQTQDVDNAHTDAGTEEKAITEEETSADVDSVVVLTEEDETEAETEAEETETEIETESETEELPAQEFSGSTKTMQVQVIADEGAFPEGTTMVLEDVEDDLTLSSIEDLALEAASKDSESGRATVSSVHAVDITFFDADQNEIEPLKPIRVFMTPVEVPEENSNPVIVHVDNDGNAETLDSLSGEALSQAMDSAVTSNAAGDNKSTDADNSDVDSINASVVNETVAFEADAFSVYALVYTVDFHYELDGKTFDYSLQGGSAIPFSKLVQILGIVGTTLSDEITEDAVDTDDSANENTEGESEATIVSDVAEFIGNIENITFSDDTLISVSKAEQDTTVGAIKDGLGLECDYSSALTEEDIAAINAMPISATDWAIISLKAFDTEEALTVTMKDGEVFTIVVTDARDPLGLDGQTFALLSNKAGNGGTHTLQATVHTTRDNRGYYLGNLPIDKNNGQQYALNSYDGLEYVTANATAWTFEYNKDADAYYISYNGKYLYIDPNIENKSQSQDHSLNLVTEKNEGTLIKITTDGNGNYYFGNAKGTLLWDYGSGYWLSNPDASDEDDLKENNAAFRLCLPENPTDGQPHKATMITVQDTQPGQRLIIYQRVLQADNTYKYYAINGSGQLVEVSQSSDSVYWKGNQSIEWTLEELGSGYYTLKNTETGYYLSPKGGETPTIVHQASEFTDSAELSVTLPGRDSTATPPPYTSAINCWDYTNNVTESLKVTRDGDNATLSAVLSGDGQQFYFASRDPIVTGQLTTVDTVDSNKKGIKITMFDFDGNETSNHRLSYQTDVMGGETWGQGRLQQGIMGRTLTDGFPSSTITGESYSKVWQSANGYSVVSKPANHLFIQSVYDATGFFHYSSFENFARFNETSGDFTVYDQLGTPAHSQSDWNAAYQNRGNFMPYNDLDVTTSKTHTVNGETHSGNWYQSGNSDPLPDSDPRKGERLYLLNGQNYYFGMIMEAKFMQGKDGLTDRGDPMRYEFNGDDDLYVYVDDVLLLDIGGVHDAFKGYIDFSTGDIEVYPATYPSANMFQGQKTTIKRQFWEAGRFPDGTVWDHSVYPYDCDKANQYFSGETFNDYSTHDFKMFYMERGAGASNLQIDFNLMTLTESQFQVKKEMPETQDGGEILNDYADAAFYYEAYVSTDNGSTYTPVTRTYLNNLDSIQDTTARYQDGTPVEWKTDSLNETKFVVRPGQTAVFPAADDAVRWYVKEVEPEGENSHMLDLYQTSNSDQDTTDNTGRTAEKDLIKNRNLVSFQNRPSDDIVNELRIKKNVIGTPYHADDKFEYRILLENTSGKMVPYSEGWYYQLDKEGRYVYFEHGERKYSTSPVYAEKTSVNGSVNNILDGDTIIIKGLLEGTDFYVFERTDTSYGNIAPKATPVEDKYVFEGTDMVGAFDRSQPIPITQYPDYVNHPTGHLFDKPDGLASGEGNMVEKYNITQYEQDHAAWGSILMNNDADITVKNKPYHPIDITVEKKWPADDDHFHMASDLDDAELTFTVRRYKLDTRHGTVNLTGILENPPHTGSDPVYHFMKDDEVIKTIAYSDLVKEAGNHNRGTLAVTDLPIGNYTLHVDEYVAGYTTSSVVNPETFEVTENGTVNVTATTDYQRQYGQLVIRKTLSGDYANHPNDRFIYTVHGPDGFTYTAERAVSQATDGVIEIQVEMSPEIPDMPSGNYVITETVDNSNNSGSGNSGKHAPATQSVHVAGDLTAYADFTGNYTPRQIPVTIHAGHSNNNASGFNEDMSRVYYLTPGSTVTVTVSVKECEYYSEGVYAYGSTNACSDGTLQAHKQGATDPSNPSFVRRSFTFTIPSSATTSYDYYIKTKCNSASWAPTVVYAAEQANSNRTMMRAARVEVLGATASGEADGKIYNTVTDVQQLPTLTPEQQAKAKFVIDDTWAMTVVMTKTGYQAYLGTDTTGAPIISESTEIGTSFWDALLQHGSIVSEDDNGNPYYYYIADFAETGVPAGMEPSFDMDPNAPTKTLMTWKDDNVATSEKKLSVTNRLVGALQITKKVTVNGEVSNASLTDGTYTFNVTGLAGTATAGETHTVTISFENGYATYYTIDGDPKAVMPTENNGSWTVLLPGLTPGNYTVSETLPNNSTSLKEATLGGSKVNGSTVTATVVPGDVSANEDSAKVGFWNDITCVTDVTVEKAWANDSENDRPESVSIELVRYKKDAAAPTPTPKYGSINLTHTATGVTTLPSGWTYTLNNGTVLYPGTNNNIPVGTYTLTVNANGVTQPNGYTYDGTSVAPASIVVNVGTTTEITVTSNYTKIPPEPKYGSINLTHTATGGAMLPSGWTYTLNGGQVLSRGTNNNIPVGTYTLSVGDSGVTQPSDYTYGGTTVEPVSFVVSEGNTTDVAVTSSYTKIQPTQKYGSINLTHTATGGATLPSGWTYSLNDGTALSRGNNSNIPVGIYTLTVDASGVTQPNGYTYNGTTVAPESIVVSEGNTTEVAVTSAYEKIAPEPEQATVTIQTIPTKYDGSVDVYDTLSTTVGKDVLIDITLNADASWAVNNWKYSTTYSNDGDNNNDGWQNITFDSNTLKSTNTIHVDSTSVTVTLNFDKDGIGAMGVSEEHIQLTEITSFATTPTLLNFALSPIGVTYAAGTKAYALANAATVTDDITAPEGYALDTSFSKPISLTAASNWRDTVEDLDVYDANGNAYYYAIVETDVPENYEVSYTNNPWLATANGNATLTATNAKVVGDLEVTKTVTGTNDATKDFTFQVAFTAPKGVTMKTSYPAVKTKADNTVDASVTSIDVSGTAPNYTATFTLKAGEKLQIKNLPKDVNYVVTESQLPDGYAEGEHRGSNGTIVANEKKTAAMANTYSATGTLNFSAQKTFANGTLGEKQFTFRLTQVSGDGSTVIPANAKLVAPESKTTTAQSGDTDTVSFNQINFVKNSDEDESGTYWFVLEEVVPDNAVNADGVTYGSLPETQKNAGGTFIKDGIRYDATRKWIKVDVEDNRAGVMTVTKTPDVVAGAPDGTWTNEQLGKLYVTKTVRSAADDDSDFPVEPAEGYNYNITITTVIDGHTKYVQDVNGTLGDTAPATPLMANSKTPLEISNLPFGSYTVLETSPGTDVAINAYSYEFVVGESYDQGTVEITAQATDPTVALVNLYVKGAAWTPKVTKHLNGKPYADTEFSFNLVQTGGHRHGEHGQNYTDTATTSATDGVATFDTIAYDNNQFTGNEGTFVYAITEDNTYPLPNVQYDGKTIYAKVVVKKEHGQLTAVGRYYSEADCAPEHELTEDQVFFDNTELGNLTVSKQVTGSYTPGGDDTFPFTVQLGDKYVTGTPGTGENTNTYTYTGLSDNDPEYTVKAGETITFSQLPAGTYVVAEGNADKTGYIRTTTYTVNADGTPSEPSSEPASAEVTRGNTTAVNITNNYRDAKLTVTKTINGVEARDLDSTLEKISFTIVDVTEDATETTDNITETITADDLKADRYVKEYTTARGGILPDHTYQVTETVTAPNGYVLTSSTYQVTAGTETMDEAAAATSGTGYSLQLTNADTSIGQIDFTNTYVQVMTIEKTKVWSTGEWPDDTTVTFTLSASIEGEEDYTIVDANGKTVTVDVEIGANTAGHKAAWENLPTKYNGKEIKYTVTETMVKIGENEFTGSGLTDRWTQEKEENNTITNTPVTTQVQAAKQWKLVNGTAITWPVNHEPQITVTLYNGENIATNLPDNQQAAQTITGNGVATWKKLPKYDAAGTEINWTVKETAVKMPGEEEATDVTETNPYGGEVTLDENFTSGKGYTIGNTPKTGLSVTKAWKNLAGAEVAPTGGTVTFDLYRDDEKVNTKSITLDGEADETGELEAWVATWADLDAYDINGSLYTYTVKEAGNGWQHYEVRYPLSNPEDENSERKDSASDGETITNEEQPTRIEITKQWKEADGDTDKVFTEAASIGFTLYWKYTYTDETEGVKTVTEPYTAYNGDGKGAVKYTPATVDAENPENNVPASWSVERIENLPQSVYEHGQWCDVTYFVMEDNPTTQYVTTTYLAADKQETETPADMAVEGGRITIKNVDEDTEIKVTKMWTLNGKARTDKDSVTYQLYHVIKSDTTRIDLSGVQISADHGNVTANEIHYDDGSWQVITISKLPKYVATVGEGGTVSFNLAHYYVEETLPEGSNTSVSYSVTLPGQTEPSEEISTTNEGTITIYNRDTDVSLKVIKVDATEKTKKLKGAKFQLLKESGTGQYVAYTKPTFTDSPYDTDTHAELTITDEDAGINFQMLSDGRYKLVETKNPEGYVMLQLVEITFTVTDGSIELKNEVDGTIVVDYTAANDADPDTLTVGNQPGAALPNTGGPGTRLFTILGSILAAGAGLLLLRRRRLILQ